MLINLTWDSSVTAAPAAFKAAVQQAATLGVRAIHPRPERRDFSRIPVKNIQKQCRNTWSLNAVVPARTITP